MNPNCQGELRKLHAILGGSFDPIHNGHLNIARHFLRLSGVSSFVFIPVRHHNFKSCTIVLPWEDRYTLIRKVLEPGMEVWDSDSNSSGYTSDLLRALAKLHPDKRFSFVIGADNIAALPRWHDALWLRDNVSFLAVQRPGFPIPGQLPEGYHITLVDVPPLDISSTGIRKRVIAGASIKGMVPDAIEYDVTRLYTTGEKP